MATYTEPYSLQESEWIVPLAVGCDASAGKMAIALAVIKTAIRNRVCERAMSNGARKKYNKKMLMYRSQQGMCWLCGERMPEPILGHPAGNTAPDYPTLDHVTPASQGGPKTYDNLMLAHRRCNEARADQAHVIAIRFDSVEQQSDN